MHTLTFKIAFAYKSPKFLHPLFVASVTVKFYQEFLNMIVDIFESSTLKIKHDDETLLLLVSWIGQQSVQSIHSGCWKIHEAMYQYQSFRILNDIRPNKSSIDHTSEWICNIWLPIMTRDGLVRLAWVHGDVDELNAFSWPSLACRQTNTDMVNTFITVDKALIWLAALGPPV